MSSLLNPGYLNEVNKAIHATDQTKIDATSGGKLLFTAGMD